LEDLFPRILGGAWSGLYGSSLLAAHPGIVVCPRLGNHLKVHVGMLCAAILSAFTTIHTRNIGHESQRVVMARNDVHFSSKLGHPETMNDIVREHRCLDNGAHGYMHLVSNNDILAWIPELKPPLVGDYLDIECAVARDIAQTKHGGD